MTMPTRPHRNGQGPTVDAVDVPRLAQDLMRATPEKPSSTRPIHLPESVALYLDFVEAAHRSPLTIAAYRQALGRFVRVSQGREPDSLTVRDFLDTYKNANSRLHALITVRQMFKLLVKRGIVKTDPTADIPLPKPRRRDYVPVTQDEFHRLMAVLAKDPRMQLLATVLYYVGPRITEACHIRAEDVAFHDNDFGTIDFPNRKGANSGYAVFGPEVTCLLRPWLVLHPAGWIFPRYQIGPLRPMHKGVALYKLAQGGKLAGIRGPVFPHRLRANFITEAVDSGWPQLALQQQVGHSNPISTSYYYRPTRQGLVRLTKQLRGIETPLVRKVVISPAVQANVERLKAGEVVEPKPMKTPVRAREFYHPDAPRVTQRLEAIWHLLDTLKELKDEGASPQPMRGQQPEEGDVDLPYWWAARRGPRRGGER